MRPGVLYADPPWNFRTWGKEGRDRCPDARHYDVMSLGDIGAFLDTAGIEPLEDSALFLWTVDCHLEDALWVGGQWGFQFKTVAFTWVKTSKDGRSHPISLGYWTRGNPEMCLLFTSGKPKRMSAGVRQLILAPRREHSRKPDETYERIEALLPGPYAELFSRTSRRGWESLGDQKGRWTHDRQDPTRP